MLLHLAALGFTLVFITEYFVPVGKLVCKKLGVLLDVTLSRHILCPYGIAAVNGHGVNGQAAHRDRALLGFFHRFL